MFTFKNLTVFRMEPGWSASLEQIEAGLEKARFVECGSTQEESAGWVPPRGPAEAPLAETVRGQWLMRLMIEQRVLAGSVVKRRIDEIAARRKQVEAWYFSEMQSFEGIKPPYLGPDVDEVHWMLYVVHLGKRFGASARTQMIDDMKSCGVETAAYSHPLHQQFFYMNASATVGRQRGVLPDTDRIGDRALALPLHTGLDTDQIRHIVKTLKDTATNVGAGAAIYL